jgi:hypothetical protein
MKCRFLDLIEEIGFFATTLEEEGFSLFSTLISKEEDVLTSKEEDVDSFKHTI